MTILVGKIGVGSPEKKIVLGIVAGVGILCRDGSLRAVAHLLKGVSKMYFGEEEHAQTDVFISFYINKLSLGAVSNMVSAVKKACRQLATVDIFGTPYYRIDDDCLDLDEECYSDYEKGIVNEDVVQTYSGKVRIFLCVMGNGWHARQAIADIISIVEDFGVRKFEREWSCH